MKLHVCLPEQVSLFNLHYENGYDLFVDPYLLLLLIYVSWLLETHPEDVPTDLMAGVSDPIQPFDNQTCMNDVSDFIMDSSHFDFPEWYEHKWIQEVILLGDPDNKDSTSLSISSINKRYPLF